MESLTARKGSYLSVVGQDEDETDQVWVCVSRQHLNQGTNSILVEWLEQVAEDNINDDDDYNDDDDDIIRLRLEYI